jgi:4-amino-4-deoxychorismate lyase
MPAERPLRHRGETGFHLIETMRREADGTIPRLGLHLARLHASAEALGLACEIRKIASQLAELEAGTGPQRVRLTLEPDGRSDIETAPFAPVAPDTVWTMRIASIRLASADPLLRHKTSRRAAYEGARAEFSRAEADEVLLLNEKGQLCEGTITSLFARVDEGPLVTPPLECGLLAGVLRAELIAQRLAREQVVKPEDAFAARELFVGNSLRGLVPARLSMRMGG